MLEPNQSGAMPQFRSFQQDTMPSSTARQCLRLSRISVSIPGADPSQLPQRLACSLQAALLKQGTLLQSIHMRQDRVHILLDVVYTTLPGVLLHKRSPERGSAATCLSSMPSSAAAGNAASGNSSSSSSSAIPHVGPHGPTQPPTRHPAKLLLQHLGPAITRGRDVILQTEGWLGVLRDGVLCPGFEGGPDGPGRWYSNMLLPPSVLHVSPMCVLEGQDVELQVVLQDLQEDGDGDSACLGGRLCCLPYHHSQEAMSSSEGSSHMVGVEVIARLDGQVLQPEVTWMHVDPEPCPEPQLEPDRGRGCPVPWPNEQPNSGPAPSSMFSSDTHLQGISWLSAPLQRTNSDVESSSCVYASDPGLVMGSQYGLPDPGSGFLLDPSPASIQQYHNGRGFRSLLGTVGHEARDQSSDIPLPLLPNPALVPTVEAVGPSQPGPPMLAPSTAGIPAPYQAQQPHGDPLAHPDHATAAQTQPPPLQPAQQGTARPHVTLKISGSELARPGMIVVECHRGQLVGAAYPVLVLPEAAMVGEVSKLQQLVQGCTCGAGAAHDFLATFGMWLHYKAMREALQQQQQDEEQDGPEQQQQEDEEEQGSIVLDAEQYDLLHRGCWAQLQPTGRDNVWQPAMSATALLLQQPLPQPSADGPAHQGTQSDRAPVLQTHLAPTTAPAHTPWSSHPPAVVRSCLDLLEFCCDRGWHVTATALVSDMVKLGIGLRLLNRRYILDHKDGSSNSGSSSSAGSSSAASAPAVPAATSRAGGSGGDALTDPEPPFSLTLLHRAVLSGSLSMVEAVLSWQELWGCQVDWASVAWGGLTPLHLAAVLPDSGGLAEVLLQLCPGARKAWPSVRDNDGLTPEDYVALASHMACPARAPAAALAQEAHRHGASADGGASGSGPGPGGQHRGRAGQALRMSGRKEGSPSGAPRGARGGSRSAPAAELAGAAGRGSSRDVATAPTSAAPATAWTGGLGGHADAPEGLISGAQLAVAVTVDQHSTSAGHAAPAEVSTAAAADGVTLAPAVAATAQIEEFSTPFCSSISSMPLGLSASPAATASTAAATAAAGLGYSDQLAWVSSSSCSSSSLSSSGQHYHSHIQQLLPSLRGKGKKMPCAQQAQDQISNDQAGSKGLKPEFHSADSNACYCCPSADGLPRSTASWLDVRVLSVVASWVAGHAAAVGPTTKPPQALRPGCGAWLVVLLVVVVAVALM